ncbi:MAG: glycosyltransferase family 4 protein [Candidatus Melainabacteria bacterium]|nr:glycosyltransferase family 4 protein [Candidatus Melainabacteria bacterium]
MVNYEFPPIGGGGGTTTRFLAKYIAKLGVNVDVLTAKPLLQDIYNHPDGFKLHYVGPVKKKLTTTHIPELARFMLTTIYYAKSIIKTTMPDLIHCFFAIPSGAFGLHCKKKFNIPYITSVLGADVPGFNIGDWRLNVYHEFTKGLSKPVWENSNFVVANSPALKSICKKFSPNQEIKVITNGVDEEIFYPKQFNSTNPNNNVNLLYVSRLTFQKGIWTLIKACGILKKRGVTNYKLTVIGEGHLKDEMFSLIDKYKISDKVNVLGWKRFEELPDIYRSADIFILPSVMEGMASVTLQAIACGLPIIVSRVKGNEEVLEEGYNGLSAEYNNALDFASAIEKLIKQPELRQKMSKNSIQKSKQFLWETIAKQYLELYEKSVYSKTLEEVIV